MLAASTGTPNLTATGNLFVAGTISGNGAGLTGLNASQLISGTVSFARLPMAYGRVTSDWTSSSSSYTDVTGISFSAGANENWTAEALLYVTGGSSGQGCRFKVTGPSAPTAVLITIFGCTASGANFDTEFQTGFSAASPAKTFCAGSGVTGFVRIRITVINGANAGTVRLQANNSSGSGNVTIRTNSDIVASRTS